MWIVQYTTGTGKSLVYHSLGIFKRSERAFEVAAANKAKQAKVWQCF